MLIRALLILLLCAVGASAQVRQIFAGDGAPTGYCALSRYTDLLTGDSYTCDDNLHTWGTATATNKITKTNNLADLANAAAARTNLGLGTLATQSGTFSGTSSGTNTGDQTITLTGDVTGSGVGSFAATIGASRVTNAMLAGSIDLTAKVTGSLPYANGGFAGSAATSATTGAMTVTMNTRIITITPTGACTFNASGGIAGQTATFVVTTSGASSFVLTFGTNFKSTATLATGTTTAKIFAVTFLNTNGTQWVEISRTAAQ